MVVDMEENKTWDNLVSTSQSLVSSLLVNLLLSLSSLWHWFQHLYVNLWVVSEEENSGLNLEQLQEEEDFDNSQLIQTNQEAEEEKVLDSSSQSISDSNTVQAKEEDKMTIEVSAFADAMVMVPIPDQEVDEDHSHAITHKFTLPITMRLNSEVLEVPSDQDEDLILDEFNSERGCQKSGQTDGDSCSGYCSGSGCSLPGSPIPSSNLKELHHHNQLDDHENEAESLDGDGLPLTIRRDSDSSTASEGAEVSPEVLSRIVSQVEVS